MARKYDPYNNYGGNSEVPQPPPVKLPLLPHQVLNLYKRRDFTEMPHDHSSAFGGGILDLAGVVRVQVFTSTGTYTPHEDMLYCIIEAVGGGGGGGGAAGAAGDSRCASGGGSGGYSRSIKSRSDIGTSQAVTIGAGGAGGTAGDNAGSAGGDTSVGSLVVAKGGSGGAARGLTTVGGAGGVAGTGDVAVTGQDGFAGHFNGTALTYAITGGPGGVSYLGGGNTMTMHVSTQAGAAGTTGSGGGGASVYNAASNVAGGAGGAGMVIITEFCKLPA